MPASRTSGSSCVGTSSAIGCLMTTMLSFKHAPRPGTGLWNCPQRSLPLPPEPGHRSGFRGAGIRGIGREFAGVLWSEGLFRHFDTRRQLAAYAGLAPTPWQSGSVRHEQGVSKSGNPRLRTTMVQVAWLWLRHQPDSALSLWFTDRVKRNGGRLKRTTIVAMARKLLVALWRYATSGVVIEGAILKAA
jgi:hypothetical protein